MKGGENKREENGLIFWIKLIRKKQTVKILYFLRSEFIKYASDILVYYILYTMYIYTTYI